MNGPIENTWSLARLRADVARLLHEDPAEIGDTDNLIDLGLDSIRAMALVTRWREAGASIEFSELASEPTLAHWWQVIARSVGQAGNAQD
ncbi:phosphopantetheine-binding protein [Verticiella sediminum]|uniref:Phosphopantetheine-binding protein n=1 Tax=Verticiella sediminum TaxID=1247510 RepID=A0A556A5U8_9BURK|nr:phosphopantetheine-binding protein [Verticiella sediminum]TSH88261.1 phosphopantetheine-binding protein [Verticiella sediminum]